MMRQWVYSLRRSRVSLSININAHPAHMHDCIGKMGTQNVDSMPTARHQAFEDLTVNSMQVPRYPRDRMKWRGGLPELEALTIVPRLPSNYMF